MTRLLFRVRPDGTLDEHPVAPPAPEAPRAVPQSFFPDDEDDDLPPGVSFEELHTLTQAGSSSPAPDSATAMFEITPGHEAQLVRWPRDCCRAVIPPYIAGYPVTAVGPLAFAPMQLTDASRWTDLNTSPVSFSVFCMRNAPWLTPMMPGPGPRTIQLPDTIQTVGAFAFWDCRQLESIQLPDAVRQLGAGVFAGCTALRRVHLPASLHTLGFTPPPVAQIMPDVGVFNGCHALQELCLPAGLSYLGAYAFNSCGLIRLRVTENTYRNASVFIHPTAFEHSASLQWLERCTAEGIPVWRIGLPVSRDKILRSDARSGMIAEVPRLSFTYTPQEMDELAFSTRRVDFLGRMAIARLRCTALLSASMAEAYIDFLADHYDALAQFWPAGEDAPRAALVLMASSPSMNAGHLNRVLRQAGELHLPQDLIAEMIALRNQRFHTVTGFEDLEL